ncbi:MAG TPA: acyl-ACP--UDP-N-acetylglucosamine O-acyltransferase [Bacteroidales bacterium]|nr:acyl-ACP--UDP-N-acetylglucosamine O-acyltransferase [Bacteroidales bacterium]
MNQPLASIHPEAKIAPNVQIEPFVSISKDVEIGEGTWIGPNATIMEGARIGKNCQIFPGAVIGAVPQDLKYEGEYTTTEVGDNTTIRECVTINRGTKSKNKTVVGNNCLLMAYAHVAHDCIIGNNVILGNVCTLAGEIVVDDFAILSGLVAVHQFVHIGSHVMISGGALVRKDVPPFVKAAREPLSYVGVNSIGLRRRNFSNDKINAIQEMYREIYMKGNNNSQAIENIESSHQASRERDEILDFLRTSKRGIIKGYFSDN